MRKKDRITALNKRRCNEFVLRMGQHIQELRCRRKLCQRQVAERAGLHHSSIGPIERGERNVTLITIAKIGKALGVSMSYLLNV
jgi:transcriptional regulator with XRE-family HTH domain